MKCSDRLLWVWLLLLCLASGCFSATKEEKTDHEMAHFPPHWPGTIFNAVERIESIRRSDGPMDSAANSLEEELIDLVQWLPELMADSDLKEPDFHRVDAWVTRWVPAAKDNRLKGAEWKSLLRIDGFDESVDHLLQISRAEKSRLDALEGK
jgi:hypothetical protein